MAQQIPRSAAAALYPHLKAGTPELVQRRHTADIASAMYAHLRPPAPKPPNPYRESLLRGLRELNAKIDARLQREGRR